MRYIIALALIAIGIEAVQANQESQKTSLCDAYGVWAFIAAESRDNGISQRQLQQDVQERFGGTTAYTPISNIVDITYDGQARSPSEHKRLTVEFCEALSS